MPYVCRIICGTMYVYMCECVCAIFWQGNAIKFQKSSWGTFPPCLLCVQKFMQVILNLLQPTGYVMHQQFNIQQLYTLPTLYLCVLYLSEKTANCATYSIN